MLRQTCVPVRVLRRATQATTPQCRCFSRSRRSPSRTVQLDTWNVRRLSLEAGQHQRRRLALLVVGAIAGSLTLVAVINQVAGPSPESRVVGKTPYRLDSSLPPSDPIQDSGRKVIIHDNDGNDLVPTGYPTVPHFPRILSLPDFITADSSAPRHGADAKDEPKVLVPSLEVPVESGSEVEYTLVGLGMRTVTFLGINVYLVGFYVATADIAELQSRLVKTVNPIASTLVASEKDELRAKLIDGVKGEQLWEELLRSNIPARSVFRVVPVRDTDYPHLRDGFVRAIQARSDKTVNDDPTFGESVKDFRGLFQRGKLHAQKELLMARDKSGTMAVIINLSQKRGIEDRNLAGRIPDERISRALWLNYLAGKNVASEAARKSFVDGIMEFVERPVGTVATQVV